MTSASTRNWMRPLPTWSNMAANVEKQQGHRSGVYKQKNKVHKHGKHRTKGEIERENKGKPDLVVKCYSTAGVVLVAGWVLKTREGFFLVFFLGEFSTKVNVVHICRVFLDCYLLEIIYLSFIIKLVVWVSMQLFSHYLGRLKHWEPVKIPRELWKKKSCNQIMMAPANLWSDNVVFKNMPCVII